MRCAGLQARQRDTGAPVLCPVSTVPHALLSAVGHKGLRRTVCTPSGTCHWSHVRQRCKDSVHLKFLHAYGFKIFRLQHNARTRRRLVSKRRALASTNASEDRSRSTMRVLDDADLHVFQVYDLRGTQVNKSFCVLLTAHRLQESNEGGARGPSRTGSRHWRRRRGLLLLLRWQGCWWHNNRPDCASNWLSDDHRGSRDCCSACRRCSWWHLHCLCWGQRVTRARF